MAVAFEEAMRSFNMNELRTNLPQKFSSRRGLSRNYSGKSQSFNCLSVVRTVEDLKKPQSPESKKRKKYLSSSSSSPHDHNGGAPVPRFPCRRVSSTNHCSALVIGV